MIGETGQQVGVEQVGAEQVGAERTIGQLVSDASQQLSELARYEVALAKAEIRRDIQLGAVGVGMFGAAAYLAMLATVLLVISAAFGLTEAGLAPWLAFLIVAVALLLIGAILVLIGRSRVRRIAPPEATIRTTKESVATLRRAARNGTAS
jgi:Putative Actinobacterial Holin-X, holin superfamily III